MKNLAIQQSLTHKEVDVIVEPHTCTNGTEGDYTRKGILTKVLDIDRLTRDGDKLALCAQRNSVLKMPQEARLMTVL